MNIIEQEKPSKEFQQAWLAAAQHINSRCQDGIAWIRNNLSRPFVEHLSFRIGNQIFFIFVDAAEFKLSARYDVFVNFANLAGATPCFMPMSKNIAKYEPAEAGWGLRHAVTNEHVNPLDMVSDELIEMTDWELYDLSVDFVKKALQKEGKSVYSSCSDIRISPSFWFEENNLHYWVVVRAGRYPTVSIKVPDNINQIAASFAGMGEAGFFASVVVANADDPFDADAKETGNFLPLYRGHGMRVKYSGIQSISNSH